MCTHDHMFSKMFLKDKIHSCTKLCVVGSNLDINVLQCVLLIFTLFHKVSQNKLI